MTREEFLDKNYERLKEMGLETYNKAVKDLREKDNATWIEEYAPLFMEAGVNTDDMAALQKTAEPLPKRLREAFGDLKFAPSEKWKNRVYKQEFSDVDKGEFEKGLAKMKEYYDQEVSQRKADTDKEKRKREVKNDWFWRDFLTSDYEKQRYVEDPQSALIGDQAPEWGKAPKTRWGSAADLGLGVAGAAGDVVPGWGSILAGPGIRAVRDVGHRLMDSPYQKDWMDIGKGFMQDASFNAATYAVPNFKRVRKVVNKAMPQIPDNVIAYKTLENDVQNTLEGLNKPFIPNPGVGKMPLSIRDVIDNTAGLTLEERGDLLRKYVSQMPDSPTKKALEGLLEDNQIDFAKAAAIANNDVQASVYAMAPEMRQAYRNTRKESGPLSISSMSDKPFYEGQDPAKMHPWYQGPKQYEGVPEKLHPYYRTILNVAEPTAKDLKTAQRAATASKLYDQFSDAAVNLPATFFNTRPTGKAPTKVETPEEREEIEAIKEREAPFWNKNGNPWFRPNKDNSLLYKAWKEYAAEQGWEVKD